MNAHKLALVQGWPDTRRALARWRRQPVAVLVPWALGALAVAATLLAAVLLVASVSTPQPNRVTFPGVTHPANAGDFTFVLYRNGLVLALHALSCVAGFMAASAPPSGDHGRLRRWLNANAGRLAISCVIGSTIFSLATQAFALGRSASDLAYGLDMAPGVLLLALLPHALPELMALFLPLAAWTLASRRGEWRDLLAATFVTVGVAVPVLVAAAAVETWVTPRLLLALAW
jgi:hypothetical protein